MSAAVRCDVLRASVEGIEGCQDDMGKVSLNEVWRSKSAEGRLDGALLVAENANHCRSSRTAADLREPLLELFTLS